MGRALTLHTHRPSRASMVPTSSTLLKFKALDSSKHKRERSIRSFQPCGYLIWSPSSHVQPELRLECTIMFHLASNVSTKKIKRKQVTLFEMCIYHSSAFFPTCTYVGQAIRYSRAFDTMHQQPTCIYTYASKTKRQGKPNKVWAKVSLKYSQVTFVLNKDVLSHQYLFELWID